MRVLLPPLSHGGLYSGKFVLSSPRGKIATGDLQRYATGENGGTFVLLRNPGYKTSHVAKRSSDPPGSLRDRVGIVEGSCGSRARRVSIRGKFALTRSPGYKTRVVAMWPNVVLTLG